MSILTKDGRLARDIAKVKSFSKLVEDRLAESDERQVARLTSDELKDLQKILQIANYTLCKYEHKKEVYSLLKGFVDMIQGSADSLGSLTDQIDLLSLSADGAVQNIQEVQSGMTGQSRICCEEPHLVEPEETKKSANNLTKSSIPVYSSDCQSKPTVDSEQVI